MMESSSVEVGSRDFPRPTVRSLAAALESSRWVTLSVVLAVAAAVRLTGLSATGFSEDEINKVRAVESYARGDFTANAEHPMAMKLATWASLEAAAAWTRSHPDASIAPEAALRFPNAIAGTATAGALFLAAEALFDTTIASWAALLWALDVNATAINRIGKEDTFFLLFLLLAVWCFERAKQVMHVPRVRDRWFNWSGAAFGLMLASKYLPGYFGLHAAFNLAADGAVEDKTPDKRLPFYAAMAAAFLAANFAIVLPATRAYVWGYLHGDTLSHTGYMFAHHLYVNGIDSSPWGTPPWFYLTYLGTKVPLVVLGAAAIGLVWTARHARHRGATFIRVFLLLTLLPYSLIAGKFVRYMLPVLAVIDLAAAVGLVWLMRRAQRGPSAAPILTTMIACAVFVPLGMHATSAAPFFSTAQNTIGTRLIGDGLLFPDDELYDAGVREAVAAIAHAAAPGAVVCSDAAAVVAEYLSREQRLDMTACSIARDGLPMRPPGNDTWVIAQPGHIYFENELVIEQIQRRHAPWLEIRAGGVLAARIYRLPAEDRRAP